jgi:serine/threonine protein kinase
MGLSANSMVEELPWFKPRTGDMEIRYPPWMAKRLLQEVLKGLAFVHANGITHGDVQPGNMLFGLRDLSDIPEDDLKQDENYHFGSFSPPLERLDGKADKWAPKYLAVPQPLDGYTNIGKDFVVKLSDFGGGNCTLMFL